MKDTYNLLTANLNFFFLFSPPGSKARFRDGTRQIDSVERVSQTFPFWVIQVPLGFLLTRDTSGRFLCSIKKDRLEKKIKTGHREMREF